MAYKLEGPWRVSDLIQKPKAPITDEFPGVYVVQLLPDKYNLQFHGPNRVICIGMSEVSVRQRFGLFLIDAFGFLFNHSEGTRFYAESPEMLAVMEALERGALTTDLREALHARPTAWDLEILWYNAQDSSCLEAALMKRYISEFGRLPLLNKNQNNQGCGNHLEELRSETFLVETPVPWEIIGSISANS